MHRLVELSLRLPAEWFAVPLDPDVDAVAWASDTAYAAWRLRADAGVPEEAVGPDAGRRLVVELAGLATNLREQLGHGAPGSSHTAVWLPVPELGIASAVVIAQLSERSADRSPERFAAALEELAEAPVPGTGYLHTQRLESELAGAPVRGLHSMIGIMDAESGVAVLEERTSFGIFPHASADMAEVLFIAERPAAFEDMPRETLALLEGLELGAVELT